MNKRIKELVEQAKAYATNSTKDYTGDEPIGFMDYYTEKFAELIVRECIGVADHSNVTGKSIIGERIKQHFGVEE